MGKIKRIKELKQKHASGSFQLSSVCLLSPLSLMLLQEDHQRLNFSLDTEMPVASHGQSAPCVLRDCMEVEWVDELVRHL